MGKKYFENKRKRLMEKRSAINDKVKAAQTADEVRRLTAELSEIDAELRDIDAALAETAEEREPEPVSTEEREAPAVKSSKLVNGQIVGAFRMGTPAQTEQRTNENPLDSMEYRTAFKDYVQRGVPIPAEIISKAEAYRASLPAEQRSGIASTTADTGAAIPMTVVRQIINTVRKRYGNLYAKVRKTAVMGGVKYPIGALEAQFSWITEGTVSPKKKAGSLYDVTFGYNTAEIRIAQSFLSQIVTMEAFEAEVARVMAIAYARAMDYGIVNGTGDGQMTGILNDPNVLALSSTNVITMTAAQMSDWTQWRKRFFAALPLGYRNGEFIFSASTVDSYLETMADSNNNPIFRQATGLEVNDGDAENPNGRFFGRNVSLVEPDILPDFDTASANDVIGIFWQPDEAYAINENFAFTMRRYFDEDTNEWIDKALVVVDGKVLNPQGIYLIKKGS